MTISLVTQFDFRRASHIPDRPDKSVLFSLPCVYSSLMMTATQGQGDNIVQIEIMDEPEVPGAQTCSYAWFSM